MRTTVTVTIEQGEKSKNPDNFLKLLSVMLENSFTRKDCVVAVGGGVVGDLSGFAAAVLYARNMILQHSHNSSFAVRFVRRRKEQR